MYIYIMQFNQQASKAIEDGISLFDVCFVSVCVRKYNPKPFFSLCPSFSQFLPPSLPPSPSPSPSPNIHTHTGESCKQPHQVSQQRHVP